METTSHRRELTAKERVARAVRFLAIHNPRVPLAALQALSDAQYAREAEKSK